MFRYFFFSKQQHNIGNNGRRPPNNRVKVGNEYLLFTDQRTNNNHPFDDHKLILKIKDGDEQVKYAYET